MTISDAVTQTWEETMKVVLEVILTIEKKSLDQWARGQMTLAELIAKARTADAYVTETSPESDQHGAFTEDDNAS